MQTKKMSLPLHGSVPVAIISLSDQYQRRADLIKKGIPIDWVENFFTAKDLRFMQISKVSDICNVNIIERRINRKLRSSEVGCSLSHLEVSRWLASSEFNMVLVLEDDIIPAHKNWLSKVELTINLLKSHADNGAAFVCLLGARHDQADHALSRDVVFKQEASRTTAPSLKLHIDPVNGLWRAHAYLLSREAAFRVLSKESVVTTLADDWNERRRLGLIDEVFYTRPILINQDECRPSTIRPADHDDYYKPYIQTSNLIQRIFSAITSRRFLTSVMSSLVFRFSKIHARIMSRFPYYLP